MLAAPRTIKSVSTERNSSRVVESMCGMMLFSMAWRALLVKTPSPNPTRSAKRTNSGLLTWMELATAMPRAVPACAQ